MTVYICNTSPHSSPIPPIVKKPTPTPPAVEGFAPPTMDFGPQAAATHDGGKIPTSQADSIMERIDGQGRNADAPVEGFAPVTVDFSKR